ncbi:hypothetical protein [Teredinibacter haidensis]|uniref:hypothetical protein n=1 Tax=Teredinibacter haidensis TaxID=2731755 RepID=UPI000949185E|nr:hypothetical protein [Teredinibacter haidensis]
MKSSLVIDKNILSYMDEAISLCKDEKYVLSVVKGDIEENPPGKWVLTMIPENMSDEMVLDGEASRIEIEGREMTVYPITLIGELENKRLCWGREEMELVSIA